jgi:nucleotide-binding universal stress UspA family protein
MYQRIMVPLDGSARAEGALPVAAQLARASQATLILTCVVTIPLEYGYAGVGMGIAGLYGPATASVPLNTEVVDVERAESQKYLANLAGSPDLHGIQTKIEVRMGSPALSLIEAISDQQADLVVMTSHGRTGALRWVLGSVAQHLVRHSSAPVLVLREHGPSLASRHPGVDHLLRVLVALDGSALAEAALTPAAQLAVGLTAPSQAALHLVLVAPPYAVDEANRPDAFILEGAREYLTNTARQMQQRYPGMTVTWSVGVGLDTAETIIRVAENGEDAEGAGVYGGCDVVALATHGRSGIARWALGSIAERVLYGTKLPLLIVRPAMETQNNKRAK